MKVLHVADSHLGYAAYRKTTEIGINQRENDVYNAFKQIVDYAIHSKPDLIIHAGDFFDSVRPNNRAIKVAINQILRIMNENIPLIVIAGNHDQPKLKETGHIFSIFDHLEGVYPVYKGKYETFSFNFKKENVIIHVIPQCDSIQKFNDELNKLKIKNTSDVNMAVLHGAITGIKEFGMNEFNELFIPTKRLNKDFDYIALGHYHKYAKISENTYYAGSTESFTFADAGDKKGFIELDLSKKKSTHVLLN